MDEHRVMKILQSLGFNAYPESDTEGCGECGEESPIGAEFKKYVCVHCKTTLYPCSKCDQERMDRHGVSCLDCPLGPADGSDHTIHGKEHLT